MTVQLSGGIAPGETMHTLPKRNLKQAMFRGMMCRCPACGKGSAFGKYLKVAHACEACGEELHHHRADDAPPYFTVLILGHILIPLVLAVEVAFVPALWLHMAIWIPLSIALTLAVLPPVKGTLVGLQWALYMHGFDPNVDDEYAMMAGVKTAELYGQ
ncbi:DUF983 domain-containing protein [Breoghania sp. L-A4]|uniref:DUF983 domain-containing protein n=1 Tax=Breoghania sp. L-A4 TaxID=2304600 RepID=UPI0020C06BA5|nr:DUF983 domain-containing protein [Breoghania sp. L-A4]